MAILNQFGAPFRNTRFARAASRNLYRGPLSDAQHRGVDELIPSRDRRTLAGLSRHLVFGDGPAKEAIRQKASYSVGYAWQPVYSGSDVEAGENAVSWLTNVWFPVCDIAGGGSDWHEFLEMASKAMDRDGEEFVLLTENDAGFPMMQHVPSYMVGSLDTLKVVDKGPYLGLNIADGIIFADKGNTVAFRVMKDATGKEFEDISARDMIHVFDRDFPEQRRGFPAFSHALDDMKNSLSSKELETIRQNIISSIYLIETSENGPDPDDPAWSGDIDSTNAEATLREDLAPGVRHIKGGENIETIKHENPGNIWESFQDRLIRSAIVGVGWAYSLVWKSPGQGTAERAEIVRARKAVEARQKKLRYIAKRAITYALAVADSQPRLTVKVPGNMLKWSFTTPERLTVDDGREARAMQDGVKAGTISETTLHGWTGKTPEQHYREQAGEKVMRARVAREVTESNVESVVIDPDELGAHFEMKAAPVMEPPQ